MKTSNIGRFKILGVLGLAAMMALGAITSLGGGQVGPGAGTALAAANATICFALDGSGSMSPTDFALQRDAIAAAVEDATIVPHDATVEVSVVKFASGAANEVAPTVVDATSSEPSGNSPLGNAIRAITFQGGGTNIEAGLNACVSKISGSSKFKAINIATNGGANIGETDPAVLRAATEAAGIDRLDAEAVGIAANLAFLKILVFPGTAEQVAPGGTPSGVDGFVMEVLSFADFAEAIAVKIPIVIGPVPPPPPIGGVGFFPDVEGSAPLETAGSSGNNASLLAGVIAGISAVAITVTGAAWYARRRLVGR